MASLSRTTTRRAVHLRIHPRPQNLGESREILRVISNFGDVEYFRNLKYDKLTAPQTALAIFKSSDAAAACMRKSPIRFRLGPALADETAEGFQETAQRQQPPTPAAPTQTTASEQPRSPSGAPFGMSQTRALSTAAANELPKPPRKQPPMPFIGDLSPPPPQVSRVFQVTVNDSRANHRDQIDSSKYHNSFPIERTSAIQADLEKKVPITGLSCWDWRVEGPPWRTIREEKKHYREGPERRKSLGELYEEGPSGE